MKPYEIIQLVLGIIVGACVLIPSASQNNNQLTEIDTWPKEIPLETALGRPGRGGARSRTPRALPKIASKAFLPRKTAVRIRQAPSPKKNVTRSCQQVNSQENEQNEVAESSARESIDVSMHFDAFY